MIYRVLERFEVDCLRIQDYVTAGCCFGYGGRRRSTAYVPRNVRAGFGEVPFPSVFFFFFLFSRRLLDFARRSFGVHFWNWLSP